MSTSLHRARASITLSLLYPFTRLENVGPQRRVVFHSFHSMMLFQFLNQRAVESTTAVMRFIWAPASFVGTISSFPLPLCLLNHHSPRHTHDKVVRVKAQ